MKYVMGLASAACFLGALFSLAFVVSDIQLIIVEVDVIGGFLLAGMAAALHAIVRSQPAVEVREVPMTTQVPPRPKKRGLRGIEDRLLGPRDAERFSPPR